jgi:hypothetical protein
MQVVFQYDVAVALEAGFQIQEPSAIQQDVHRFRAGEQRQSAASGQGLSWVVYLGGEWRQELIPFGIRVNMNRRMG